jgi:multisubunit Na+/H+ antiporter MnhG subunit
VTAQHAAALVLMWAGVAVAAGSGLGLLVLRSREARLHLLTPVTSLAAPLVGLGVAVELGWGRNAVKVAVVVAVLAVAGGVLTSATAQASRAVAGRSGT